MFEIITALISVAGAMFTGFALGTVNADRKHRRRNAATAQCAACEWSSGPVPLSDAFKAARSHESVNGRESHLGIVVRA